MRESRILTSLMIVAMVAVDLAVLVHASPPDPLLRGWPTPELVVLFSLAFSQVSLVTVWAGLGTAWVPWRVAGLTLVVTLWSIGLATSVGGFIQGYNKNVWTVHLLSQAALILAMTLFFRWRGRRLVHQNSLMEIEGKEEGPTGRRRFQFSISYLMAWMTAIAITLGMLQCTVDFTHLQSSQFKWDGILLCDIIAIVTVSPVLLLTLDSRPQDERVGDLGFVILLAIVSLAFFSQMGPSSRDFKLAFLGLFLLEPVFLIAAFGVLRMAGLRMITDRTAS